MGMKTCTSVPPTDSQEYSYQTQYYKITLANSPQLYCLQCCGGNPTRQDNWEIQCKTNVFTALTTNIYGYEFRMGVEKTLGGPSYISCPLKRSACTYDSNDKLIGCAESDTLVLYGYHLTLNVIRYTNNLDSWRGVSSCSAVAFESTVALNSGIYIYL
jgi:hypothetical protein